MNTTLGRKKGGGKDSLSLTGHSTECKSRENFIKTRGLLSPSRAFLPSLPRGREDVLQFTDEMGLTGGTKSFTESLPSFRGGLRLGEG